MDYVQMMLEAQRRDGILDSAFDRIGQFEKHTKVRC